MLGETVSKRREGVLKKGVWGSMLGWKQIERREGVLKKYRFGLPFWGRQTKKEGRSHEKKVFGVPCCEEKAERREGVSKELILDCQGTQKNNASTGVRKNSESRKSQTGKLLFGGTALLLFCKQKHSQERKTENTQPSR